MMSLCAVFLTGGQRSPLVGVLDEISDVHGHLLDLRSVERLNFAHGTSIIRRDEVDGHTLAAETTGTTDTVNVVLTVRGWKTTEGNRNTQA
jgi:hypothetical protein